MWLGLNLGAWLFWVNLLALSLGIGMTVYYRRTTSLRIVGMGCSALAVAFVWAAQGECVLPQDPVVEYHQGMTLCPGQAARVRIEIPQPATGI